MSATKSHLNYLNITQNDSELPPPRAEILYKAADLVTRDRNDTYGPPSEDFERTATMLNAQGFTRKGKPLVAHDVAIIQINVKLSRLTQTPDHKDSHTDIAGYVGCGWECVTEGKLDGDVPIPRRQDGRSQGVRS